MFKKPEIKSVVKDILFLSVVSVFLLAPLGHPQLFWSHEEAQYLWRSVEFNQNTFSGMPGCRWFPDFARGLGLPFLEYFPPFFLAFAQTLRLVGLGIISSVKITLVIVTLLGSFFTYLFAKNYWGRNGAILSALLFSYAPYHIVNLFVRGDFNEYLAMTLLPMNLYLLERGRKSFESGNLSISFALGIAVLTSAHYPSCVIHLPIYVFILLWNALFPRFKKRFLIAGLSSLLFGLVISSPWWLTAFSSRHLVQMAGMTRGFADYQHQFIAPFQWISFYWNYGASIKGLGDTISFQIGNLAIICIILGTPAWKNLIRLPGKNKKSILPYIAVTGICLVLTLASSAWFWKISHFLPMLQFPYRFLQIIAVLIAFWAGSLGKTLDEYYKDFKPIWPTIFAVYVVMFSLDYCNAAVYMHLTEKDMTPKTVRRVAQTHNTGETIPKTVGDKFPPKIPANFVLDKIPKNGFSRIQMEAKVAKWIENGTDVEYWQGTTVPLGIKQIRPQQFQLINGEADIHSEDKSGANFTLDITCETPVSMILGQFYFPGWDATLDGNPLAINSDSETGLIKFSLPPGKHQISLIYNNLPVSRFLNWLSVAALLILFLFNYVKKRIQNEAK